MKYNFKIVALIFLAVTWNGGRLLAQALPKALAGTWVLDEKSSTLGVFGEKKATTKMIITVSANLLKVERFNDDTRYSEEIPLDGKLVVFKREDGVTKENQMLPAADGLALKLKSVLYKPEEKDKTFATFTSGWKLSENGEVLTVDYLYERKLTGNSGTASLVYRHP